jgi:hypothetical protein
MLVTPDLDFVVSMRYLYKVVQRKQDVKIESIFR